MPTRARPISTIGNSSTSPNASSMVVTNPMYRRPSAAAGRPPAEAEEEVEGVREEEVADEDAGHEEEKRGEQHQATGSAAPRVSPGVTKRHSWNRMTGMAIPMPMKPAIFTWTLNASAGPLK